MEFFFFSKKISKNIGKIISKNISGKYSQKRLDHTKQCATKSVKTVSKRTIQKTVESYKKVTKN